MTRKYLIFSFILIVILVSSNEAFAVRLLKGDTAKGTILYLNIEEGKIIIDDYRSGKELTYKIKPSLAESFKEGQVVIIISDPGSDIVKVIKPVKKR